MSTPTVGCDILFSELGDVGAVMGSGWGAGSDSDHISRGLLKLGNMLGNLIPVLARVASPPPPLFRVTVRARRVPKVFTDVNQEAECATTINSLLPL